MRAILVHEFGPIEKAVHVETADPMPGAGEVVVDLAAVEVNYPDILYMEGRYQRKPPLPFSPGLAGAGAVSAVGEGVTSLSVGQKVLVLPEYGTYAEKVRAPADFCLPVPEDMPANIAAAFGLVYQTAYFALTARAGLTAGQSVLVLGASGGIGMAAVQLAKALDAGRVIATTRGDAGVAFARQIGADDVIDTQARDLREAVKELTGGRGVDVVIDPVGGDLSIAAMRTLAWSGHLVVVGFASGTIPNFPANYLLVKNVSVSGLQWTDYRSRSLDAVRAAQNHIYRLWQQQRLSPVISRTFPLERFAEALDVLKHGNPRGKMVLTTEIERA
ncbi:NADPH:quinone oxidoreductase family protein [Mesorhizobium sp. A556]